MIDTPNDSTAVATVAPMKPPTKRTLWQPGQLTKAIKMIAKGNSIRVACHTNGIPPATFTAWLQRGKDDEKAWESAGDVNAPKSLQHGLLVRYRKAVGERESTLVSVVHDSATDTDSPNVADAKWLLARFNPKRWGEKSTLTLNGEPPISREELMSTIRQMATVVQEEVMAMTCTETERIMALNRIEASWTELLAAVRLFGAQPSPAPVQAPIGLQSGV